MNIDSLDFEELKSLASSTLTYLKVRAKVTGSWSGNYKFLAEMESMPFKIKVQNFRLSSEAKSIDSNLKSGKSANMWQSLFEINILKYK